MENRPDPDDILRRVQEEERADKRGKLKIFFGMSPGVGKTYAMLEAARQIAKEGRDVVIGYVEPHARPETMLLVMGLDLLPRHMVNHRGKILEELDVEGAIARKPDLILVDELAHSNAEGSIYPKRWQEIERLLEAGLDVYTTLNVQHLESVNDIVTQITSAPVRETVPDHVFENADEVELVDIAPPDLIQRMKEGKVYVAAQARHALENFFRQGNLIALRELALRKMADRVGEQAVDYRDRNSVAQIWPTSGRLLVLVGPSPMSAQLVRAARRMASGMRSKWFAVHVENSSSALLPAAARAQLEENLRLAISLGAVVETVTGEDFAEAIIDYARRNNILRILIGKPQPRSWRHWFRRAFVYNLIEQSGEIDVVVMSSAIQSEIIASKEFHSISYRNQLLYLWPIISVAICTIACRLLFPYFQATNLAMVYLAGIVVVALFAGRGPSIAATILSVATFDFFFIEPYGTFTVTDSQYLLTFVVLLTTGLVISELASRIRLQADASRDRERRTSALFGLSRELTSLPTKESVSQAACKIIGEALACEVTIHWPEGDAKQLVQGTANDSPPMIRDSGVIRWVFEHRRPAGHGTDTLPGTPSLYLPLIVLERIVGVIGIHPQSNTTNIGSPLQLQPIQAFADQVAMALERCLLATEAEAVRLQIQTEKMRSTLLSVVSHDLRTPLATITGSASLLLDTSNPIEASARQELTESILDESDRLARLVSNLLDMTKLQAGAMQVHTELQPIEDVIGVALDRLERPLREYKIETNLGNNLPPVSIDGLLIEQVVINLLDNAMKFSPPGSSIAIECKKAEDEVVVSISDRGCGLMAMTEQQLFAPFVRGPKELAKGSGLGLAICYGIIQLHHGSLHAANRPDGGAIFWFTMKACPQVVNGDQ